MDITRRLNAHRTLSLALSGLALVGWGAFAYLAGSSASAARDLRAELAQSKATQDQLLAERNQQQEAVGDLAQIQAKLASTRDELAALAQRREQAKAQVAAVQQELIVLTKRREEKQAKVSEKGGVRGAKPSSKPARLAARTKHET
jgi:zinc resistance-associated protein